MKRIRRIKNNIKRYFPLPPEHIGYVRFGEHMEPDYRCPAEDSGFGVSDDWICCPHCGQRLGEFKEKPEVEFVTMGFKEEVENASIGEDIAGD